MEASGVIQVSVYAQCTGYSGWLKCPVYVSNIFN